MHTIGVGEILLILNENIVKVSGFHHGTLLLGT